MEKINFVNNSEPYLSAENLNQMQSNIEEVTHRDITTDGEAVKAGYKVDGKDVYVKKVSLGSLPNSTNKNYTIGLTNIVPDDMSVILKSSGNVYGKIPNDYSHFNYNSETGTLALDVSVDLSTYTGVFKIYYTEN